MTGYPPPLPPGVYRRRRMLAGTAFALMLVGVTWLVGAMVGSEGPAVVPQGAQQSNPPSPADTPVAASSSSSSATSPPPPAPTPTLPPGPPPVCEDAQLGVTAKVGKPAYRSGEQPEFAIVVSNTGPLPCLREIGREVRELVVSTADGKVRLWSSNDCLATEGRESRVLAPGERFEFGARWAGSTSEPGCGKHTRLGPGDYLLTARVSGKSSDPVVFRLE
ncbi:hypothetical protein [Saccharothrix violaceirubra]|uniref:Uncharacterized protein n=1 Tax=Saccharothrix violaceirubra TaxID=413306 RepID=A0A7W7T9A5_9PSEU|nr:hypothetical protein [Saccharothrix violaceirubra]MBB4968860.1 hypothetical protein [Saccharothrix violaceirubra]